MGGALAGSAARIAGGMGMVACAAVVAFAVGGGGVFGGLVSLFGSSGKALEVAHSQSPSADIVAAPTAAERAAVQSGSGSLIRDRARPPGRKQHRQRTAPPRSSPAPGSGGPAPLQPPPIQPPPLPPGAPPSPGPGGGQTVATVGDAVKQIAGQAPPQLQPLTTPVSDAIDTVVQTCRGLPGCP